MDAGGSCGRSRALASASVLGRGRWDADALRDVVRDYALETLADPDAVLVLDETGFLKQGTSCGVHRQYTARPARSRTVRSACSRLTPRGTVTRSSIGLVPAGPGPRIRPDWPPHVPEGTSFSTSGMALAMIERSMAADVPFSGSRPIPSMGPATSRWLCGARARATCSGSIDPCSIPGSANRRWPAPPRRSPRPRTVSLDAPVGGRGHEGAPLRLGLLRVGRPRRCRLRSGRPVDARLLIRRSLTDGSLAYFTTWCPPARRSRPWRRSRASVGRSRTRSRRPRPNSGSLARSWHGWHRHVSLVMMAFALLAVIRHHANVPPQDGRGRDRARADPWSVQEIRRIAVRLAQRRIQPAHVIAWSLWRRAHQAAADAYLKRRASAERGR